MKRLLTSMAVALGLIGCAATSDLPGEYVLDPKQPEGFVIVSLTLSGEPMEKVSSLEFRLRMLPPKDGEAVVARPYFESPKQFARGVSRVTSSTAEDRRIVVKGPGSGERLDLREGAMTGRVASMLLPAGSYELYTWALKEPAGQNGGTEYGPQRPFSYQFVVTPGRATYIGQLNLHLNDGKMQKITVEDRRERDLALLKKKVPSIGAAQVVSEVGRVRP